MDKLWLAALFSAAVGAVVDAAIPMTRQEKPDRCRPGRAASCWRSARASHLGTRWDSPRCAARELDRYLPPGTPQAIARDHQRTREPRRIVCPLSVRISEPPVVSEDRPGALSRAARSRRALA